MKQKVRVENRTGSSTPPRQISDRPRKRERERERARHAERDLDMQISARPRRSSQGGSQHLSFTMGALMAAGGAFSFASMFTFTFVSLYLSSIFWSYNYHFYSCCLWGDKDNFRSGGHG